MHAFMHAGLVGDDAVPVIQPVPLPGQGQGGTQPTPRQSVLRVSGQDGLDTLPDAPMAGHASGDGSAVQGGSGKTCTA